MNYNDLEQRYDAFVSHEKYAEIKKLAERNFHKAESEQKALELSNWEFNLKFLNEYLARAINNEFHTANRYSIEINGNRIDLDITQSPDFRDKEKYLDWLYKQINN